MGPIQKQKYTKHVLPHEHPDEFDMYIAYSRNRCLSLIMESILTIVQAGTSLANGVSPWGSALAGTLFDFS